MEGKDGTLLAREKILKMELQFKRRLQDGRL
jgi:hypothetical protein